MDGLVPGRVVYYVFGETAAKEVMRRRTTSASIAERMKDTKDDGLTAKTPTWPAGAQAHIGNDVKAGDILPAMVVRVWSQESGCSNLRVILDGTDEYWATSVNYYADKRGSSWHWMREERVAQYDPNGKDIPEEVAQRERSIEKLVAAAKLDLASRNKEREGDHWDDPPLNGLGTVD